MKQKIIPQKISFKEKGSASLKEKLIVDVLGAKNILRDCGINIYRLHDGSIAEFYGVGPAHSQAAFAKENMLLSFHVSNIEAAVKHMVEAGATTVEGVIRPCHGYAYCHLRFEDGQIIGLHTVE